MAAEVRIQIEVPGELEANELRGCIVRCLSGIVRPEITFSRVVDKTLGTEIDVSIRVLRIIRYGKEVDIVDPPHSAKLDLAIATPMNLSAGSKLIGST